MADQWSVAEALRIALKQEGISLRELARRSQISAAQLSRLQAGGVERPSPRTLVALGRGLGRNPAPLLVLAGAVDQGEARRLLLDLLQHGNELAEEWEVGGEDVEGERTVLRDADAPPSAIRKIAFDAFLTESLETQWDEAHELLGAEADTTGELREIVQLWSMTLNAERRRRIVEFVRDQAQLSQLEQQWEIHAGSRGLGPDGEPAAGADEK